jgi:hypothetical protein
VRARYFATTREAFLEAVRLSKPGDGITIIGDYEIPPDLPITKSAWGSVTRLAASCEFTAPTLSEFTSAVKAADVGDRIVVTGGYAVPVGLPVVFAGVGVWLKTANEETE